MTLRCLLLAACVALAAAASAHSHTPLSSSACEDALCRDAGEDAKSGQTHDKERCESLNKSHGCTWHANGADGECHMKPCFSEVTRQCAKNAGYDVDHCGNGTDNDNLPRKMEL